MWLYPLILSDQKLICELHWGKPRLWCHCFRTGYGTPLRSIVPLYFRTWDYMNLHFTLWTDAAPLVKFLSRGRFRRNLIAERILVFLLTKANSSSMEILEEQAPIIRDFFVSSDSPTAFLLIQIEYVVSLEKCSKEEIHFNGTRPLKHFTVLQYHP